MSKKVTKKTFVLLITIIMITATMLIVPETLASTGTRLYIDPPSIIDPSIEPCTTFIVNATLENITDLWNWQVKIFFNPDVLECTDAFIPPDSPFKFALSPTPSIDNDAGFVMLGSTQLSGMPSEDGSGTLACIEFHVKSKGVSNLNFDETLTYLKNPGMQFIPANLEDGYFSNWIPPPPAKLYVNPARVVNPMLTPCNNFTVNISIINATDLYAWQLTVPFPTAIINALNVTEGPLLKSGGTTVFEYDIIHTVNATHGVVLMRCNITDGTGVNGNGDLATITFHVEDFGETSIPIIDEVLYDSLDSALPHDTFNGYFNNMLIAKLSVEPPEIIDPTLIPCSEFDINITLDDVEDIKSCQFNLTYNTEPLTVIGITFFKVLNQIPTPSMILDDQAGFIWVKLIYPNTITTYSPLPLIKITFHVDAFGISWLNLTDTRIKDSLGQPIIHEVQNGYFASVIRDIAIIDVKTYSTLVYQGWLTYINVTVKNEGDLTETFDVKAFYDVTLINMITVENLPPNENMTITFTWDTAGVPACSNYTISAEAVPVLYETDLEDNILTDGVVEVWLMGDINGDRVVDMTDMGLVGAAFGSAPGDLYWRAEADLDQNNLVDMTDLGLVAQNYGKTC